jgi:DNA (cytosine-5)-methyltransferase 1
MFGLNIWRHRYFETSDSLIMSPSGCNHGAFPRPILLSGTTRRRCENGRIEHPVAVCRQASGIDWMIRTELDEAIPPAYTEWIGLRLLAAIRG